MHSSWTSNLEAKVVILGSQGVGKTSLVVRYISKTFAPNSTSTIGASFMTKKLTVDNCKVHLQIWDTAGQERFRAMSKLYYRGAQAALLVYDITSQESFQELHSWIEELKRNMSDELVMVVVANKIDLASRREVTLEQAREYVTRVLGPDTLLYEVSAKEDDGAIDDIFLNLTRNLVDRKQYLPRDKRRPPPMNIIEADPPSKPSSCCGIF
ncbi:ras-like GTP-binding protein RYL2 [Halteromyces radiatus]|uniref:ras-like GTP-binding protein RYL2 n=1 Tax=Halteromyces radiatus TaxID=101107 RepID=UPI00221ECB54|nr:ras-like GTP-binding protein RYL2 [Halteromyces radiatus]KAI8093202.1 ras-like GTP-binding protein RYL2 [Halteromyces radiatus]